MLNREVMTKEEYESSEYIEFHYNRDKRNNKKRIGEVKPRYTSRFSGDIVSLKDNKKKIKMMLVLNLGLLIIAAIIFFSNYFFTKPVYSDVYTKDGLELSITTLKSNDFTYNLYLNLSNNTDDKDIGVYFNEGNTIKLLQGKEPIYKQEITLPDEVKLVSKAVSEKDASLKSERSFTFPIRLYDKNILFDRISLTLFMNGEEIELIENILHNTN
jgi:hypothetical protein